MRADASVAFGPWSFRAVNDPGRSGSAGFGDWMPAVVPGCVHTDLLRAGKIPDPFQGTNEKDLQWIERTDWEYRGAFEVDGELLDRQRVELVFAGLDTYAEVSLNGTPVLFADNMFRTFRADVRAAVVAGSNELLIRFRSPIAYVDAAYRALGYRLPAANDQAQEMVSMFTRKAPYHYGWDWGPRFVTSGVWREVRLEAWDEARLDDVQVVQRELDEARALLDVIVTVEAARAGTARIAVALADGAPLADVEAPLLRGSNRVTLKAAIPSPERWWPNGLGPQRLYVLETALAVGGAPRGRRATRIGLRTVEVVHERDADGKSFVIRVNGAPVFMKGANYIPSDSFLDRVTPERHRTLLESAAAAHMNMLRVWGGGVYEEDRFYDLADELGILIWQDFMFACSMYPGTPAFLDSVRAEAVDNVRRLRNHACLALWAGNNEIEAAWRDWGWQAKFQIPEAAQRTIARDYQRLFHDILPAVVVEEDPGRFYTRSSPSANEDGVPPNKLGFGDNHYWGVWHAEAPYEAYVENTSRFMSEYGFQSFPTLETVERYAPRDQWRIDSPVMLAHQRHPRGNALVLEYMRRDFHVPTDFASFLYMSQVLQATIIQYAAEAHRRRWPHNAGSLYWQLDDCWPVASWSGIDYFGRWKALHYAARRFFAPVLVSPVDEGKGVRIFVVSDRAGDLRGRLRARLVDLAGTPGWSGWSREEEVVVKARSSEPLLQVSRAELVAAADARKVVLVAELHDEGGSLIGRNLLFLCKTRELDLPAPELETAVRTQAGAATVRVSARRFARAVWLSAPGEDGAFSENFFDLLPGESVTSIWRPAPGGGAVDAARLAAALRTVTVRDTY